jgi:hypothetical protein
MYTLIQTAKLNGIDPQAWLADTHSCIAEKPQSRLSELLPWNWTTAAPPARCHLKESGTWRGAAADRGKIAIANERRPPVGDVRS